MIDKRDDGGPAFPHVHVRDGRPAEICDGLSLRDYFAAKATQPGVSEIITAAGLREANDGKVICEDGCERTFNFWWRGLTNEYRFQLAAKVRYQEADAMIAERNK